MCSDLWLEEMQEISDIEFNCVIGIRNKTERTLELNGTEKHLTQHYFTFKETEAMR